jgi:hypothetical protein
MVVQRQLAASQAAMVIAWFDQLGLINPTFATRGVEAAKLEVFRGVRSKGRHHTGRCHGAATSTEAILGDG